MKQDEFMESIYGCLERIENKVNGLSMPQSVDGNSEADNRANEIALQEFKQNLNGIKAVFKRLFENVSVIKGDTADLLKRNSMSDKSMEVLSALKNEYKQNHKQQNDTSDKIIGMLANMETKQIQESEEIKSMLRVTDKNIKSGIYNESHHSFSIETPYIFWGFSGMFAMIVVLAIALYFAKQPDYDRIDNDLKYRYIKMKGEASTERINELENMFEVDRNDKKIRQLEKDVEIYEETVMKQAVIIEQTKRKEHEVERLDSIARTVKGK